MAAATTAKAARKSTVDEVALVAHAAMATRLFKPMSRCNVSLSWPHSADVGEVAVRADLNHAEPAELNLGLQPKSSGVQAADFPNSLTLRDALGGAAVGEGVGLHDEATELRDPREEAALERYGAQGVELTLGAAKGDDGLPWAVLVQDATVRLEDAARDALALRVRRAPILHRSRAEE